MKQADKVIRKGDYYEMEVVDDALSSMKPYKKEETSPHLPPPPENLISNLPLFSQARANYYFQPVSAYSNAEPDQLLHELQDILITQKLSDSDKQEILKLIKEIRLLKEQPLVPLIELTPDSKIKQKQPLAIGQIELKVKVQLGELENKVAQLQKFGYPQLNAYQHQLEILLGEKKISSLSQLPKDDRNKQEIEQLFAQCSSLTSATDIAGLVTKIHSNSSKYEEMLNWTQRLQGTIGFHFDFLTELSDDEQLLNKLETNFQNNISSIKQAIEGIKKQARK